MDTSAYLQSERAATLQQAAHEFPAGDYRRAGAVLTVALDHASDDAWPRIKHPARHAMACLNIITARLAHGQHVSALLWTHLAAACDALERKHPVDIGAGGDAIARAADIDAAYRKQYTPFR